MQLPEGECVWLKQRRLVVAEGLIATLEQKLRLAEGSLAPLHTCKGSELVGCTYRHPLFDRSSPVVMGGDYITTDAGTGLVHTAPGHGQDDYLVGQRYGLPLLSPVDDAGTMPQKLLNYWLEVLGKCNVMTSCAPSRFWR